MNDALGNIIETSNIVVKIQRPLQIGVVVELAPNGLWILFWAFHKTGVRVFKTIEPDSAQLVVINELMLSSEYDVIKLKSRNVKDELPRSPKKTESTS